VNELSGNTVEKSLRNFGLTEKETRIYIFLAKHGPQGAGEIASGTKTATAVIYRTLKALQRKGFAELTLESPVRYTAVPFENVLDLKIRGKQDEVRQMENSKSELLTDWRKISTEKPEYPLEKFTVIKGDNKIFTKIFKMIKDTKGQLSTVSTVTELIHADRYGIFEAINNHPLGSKVEFRIITDLSTSDLISTRFLRKRLKRKVGFRVRNPELGLRLYPRMVIKDEEEIVFFIDSRKNDFASKGDDVCLWTNCKSLVRAFLAMFEELWRNSTDIEKKTVEIETGKPTPETCIIKDAQVAKKKYVDTMRSAETEIIMMTSSEGLMRSWRNMPLLKEWGEKGVSTRIMAPITSENLQAAQELSKFCTVRHVPTSYLGTAIVDGKYLFQFKETPPDQAKPNTIAEFESTFYSNDFDYVDKTKNMLNDIWKSARILSAVTLESILGQIRSPLAPISNTSRNYIKKVGSYRVIDEEFSETITEEEVLNKIIHAKKYPAETPSIAIDRMYATVGVAVIHTPDYFSLPDTIIIVYHIEKQSRLGEEDAMTIFLWLETPKGYSYVPVAVVGDNPRADNFWKTLYTGAPAGQNTQLVKKDEIQIRVHGNTLFAGWTVPISLFPPRYSLPPACVLIEGFGDVKTGAYTTVLPSGYKVKCEENCFDAFVTFFHPSSKYSGPGTDGLFIRDFVATTYPPFTTQENK
jgi:sugar-specific transcriptional regulator TrmB